MNKVLVVLILGILIVGCNNKLHDYNILDPHAFQTELNGKKIELFTLKNNSGSTAQLTNYGARLVALWVPDKNDNYSDVNLGLATGEEYINSKVRYFGNIVGRYANRIANAQFVLDGDTFLLSKNNGPNIIHGGANGFFNQVWKVKTHTHSKIEFTYLSKDGEQGFPGNMEVSVVYELFDNESLQITYGATTDQATPVNLCNHAFFNLAGEGSGLVYNHLLYINANKYTPLDSVQIPTGELATVENTPYDFTNATAIGDRIEEKFEQLLLGNGYDINYVLNESKDEMVHAATLIEPIFGRVMDVYTTEPGLQLYTGNWLDGSIIGKSGKSLKFREGVCLETQHFPDSPNKPQFPSTILYPDSVYKSVTVYKFSVME